MTIQTIQGTLNDFLASYISALGATTPLSQASLTEITTGLAGKLETVNPNGPTYPPTPR